MTFTIRDGVCRCDSCDSIVTNHWKAKQQHRCLTSATTNAKDQT